MEECDKQNWRGRVKTFLRSEDGPSATEYAILLAVLIIGAMAMIQSIGESFQGIYVAISEGVPGV